MIELDLSGNHIDDESCEAIADMIRTNTTLESLFLSNNFIRDYGTSLILDALRDNHTLIELTLNPLFSSEDDLEEIQHILDRNYDA